MRTPYAKGACGLHPAACPRAMASQGRDATQRPGRAASGEAARVDRKRAIGDGRRRSQLLKAGPDARDGRSAFKGKGLPMCAWLVSGMAMHSCRAFQSIAGTRHLCASHPSLSYPRYLSS